MYNLYLDESGELGTAAGSSKYFVIAVLSTDLPKVLKQRFKRKKAELYNDGWPKDIEIKGTELWRSDRNPRIPEIISRNRIEILVDIVNTIIGCPVKLHYSVVRKSKLTPHLLNADYGIAYNYFAGQLLTRAYDRHFSGPLVLTVDQRSKETHHKLRFDGYIATRLIGDCEHEHELRIEHQESHMHHGLQAVDFLSWGLFRHYEHNDKTFRDIIEPALGYVDRWYPNK